MQTHCTPPVLNAILQNATVCSKIMQKHCTPPVLNAIPKNAIVCFEKKNAKTLHATAAKRNPQERHRMFEKSEMQKHCTPPLSYAIPKNAIVCFKKERCKHIARHRLTAVVCNVFASFFLTDDGVLRDCV